MSARSTGANLAAAAVLFWIAWWLMPAVGITDTREILERVAESRQSVSLSAHIQLLSTLFYVAASVGVLRLPQAEHGAVRAAAALLLLGAAGSTADVVLHLLAFEMTAPGVDQAAMIPVMERMQGPNLALLGPFLAAFFAGSLLLAIGFARSGRVSRANPVLFALAIPAHALGGGLALLACVSASQAWIGASLLRGGRT